MRRRRRPAVANPVQAAAVCAPPSKRPGTLNVLALNAALENNPPVLLSKGGL